MMAIQHLTWLRVARDGGVGDLETRPVDLELDALLMEHISNLRRRADKGQTPPASFTGDEERTRFTLLTRGSKSQFLAASTEIAQRLIARMDKRSHPGLLVCIRSNSPAGAAVFKLEITEEYAGILRQQSAGEETLVAVRNLLSTPGQLQKGAVVPDGRADSEAIVGDQLADTALYFLDAIGLQQMERPTRAVAIAVDVAAGVIGSERAQGVARVIQETRPATSSELLEQVPGLTVEERHDLEGAFEAQKRPVRHFAPARASSLRKTLTASGITVEGRVADLDERVVIEPLDDRWRVVITVDQEPRVEFK